MQLAGKTEGVVFPPFITFGEFRRQAKKQGFEKQDLVSLLKDSGQFDSGKGAYRETAEQLADKVFDGLKRYDRNWVVLETMLRQYSLWRAPTPVAGARTCVVCKKAVSGKKKTCSASCRVKAFRLKAKENASETAKPRRKKSLHEKHPRPKKSKKKKLGKSSS